MTEKNTGLSVHAFEYQPDDAVQIVNQDKIKEERILCIVDSLAGDIREQWLALQERLTT